MSEQLHKTQVSILHSLRYSPSARFSALMKPTDHMSDTFKFHLRKLVRAGYVEKAASGEYRLTATGKEFANVLDEPNRMPKKQPKVSVFVVAYKKPRVGPIKFLLHKRDRNPFLGYWTGITDAVRWGETFEEAAARTFKKQTGLDADFAVHSMRRIRDYDNGSDNLLEDKLFIIIKARNIRGELQTNYAGGVSAWLSIDKLLTQEKYLISTPSILEDTLKEQSYVAQDLFHNSESY